MSQETIDQIREKVEECLSTPIDDLLVNQGKWGPLNFEDARPSMEQVFKQFPLLLEYPWRQYHNVSKTQC